MKLSQPYLTIPAKRAPIEIRELSEKDFVEYKRDSEKIHEFVYYQRRLIEIELNKTDFFENKDYYTCLYERSFSENIDFDYKEKAFIDLNRCLNNFIASFKSTTEHCEKKSLDFSERIQKN